MGKGIFDGLEERLQPFYEAMVRDLVKQRKRIGGDWGIAQAVFSRTQRDFFRKQLGPDLIFIVMNLSKECQKKRVEARHGTGMGGEMLDKLVKYAEMCQPAGEDEVNAYNLDITEDMTRDDVLKKIKEIIDKASPSKGHEVEEKDLPSKETPWANGYWTSPQNKAFFTVVDGQKADMKGVHSLDFPDCKAAAEGTWTYGQFGKCSEEIAKASGSKNYNIKMENVWFKQQGVLDKSGTKIYTTGLSNKLEILDWCNDEQLKKYKEDRDPADAPACPYITPKPNELGKFIWLSGKQH